MVRNCRFNGHWEEEETTSAGDFELERNKKFDLTILIAEAQFLVSVNGKHFCAFTFRVPLSQLTGIEVRGMVDVYSVNYKQMDLYPEMEDGSAIEIPVGNSSVPESNLVSISIGQLLHLTSCNHVFKVNVRCFFFVCFSQFRISENYQLEASRLAGSSKFTVV